MPLSPSLVALGWRLAPLRSVERFRAPAALNSVRLAASCSVHAKGGEPSPPVGTPRTSPASWHFGVLGAGPQWRQTPQNARALSDPSRWRGGGRWRGG